MRAIPLLSELVPTLAWDIYGVYGDQQEQQDEPVPLCSPLLLIAAAPARFPHMAKPGGPFSMRTAICLA